MVAKFVAIILFFVPLYLFGQDTIQVKKDVLNVPAGNLIEIFVDSSNAYTNQPPSAVKAAHFKKTNKKVAQFYSQFNNVWVRFRLQNLTQSNKLYFDIDYANISNIEVYKEDSAGSLILAQRTGNSYVFASR